MSVQTEHLFPADLTVRDAAGNRLTLADLRGDARAVALYFMRTGSCPPCLHHVRAISRMDLPGRGVQPVVVVPGPPAHAVRVQRIAGDRVTVVSSAGAEAHRAAGLDKTFLLQHSGVVLLDGTGSVRYRHAAALPTSGFDGEALLAAVNRLETGGDAA